MNLSLPVLSRWVEWPAAAALALALGLLVVLQPLFALAALAMAALCLALTLAGVSLAAGAIGGVVLGHLVTGQLYVLGRLPESFALLLDLVLVTLFVAVALRPHPRSPRSHLATIAFFTLVVLSVLNPLVPSLTYGVFGLRQVLIPLVALLVVKEAELSPRDVKFILTMLLLAWIVNLTIALRQWLFGFSGAEIAWTQSIASTYLVDGQIRLMGATQSNQDFGFLAAIAVPAVTACFLAAQQRALRMAFGVLTVLSFAVLFGTLLRSALVGGVVGAVVTAVLVSTASRRPERVLVYAGGLAGVIVVLALVAPGRFLPEEKVVTLSERVASIFSPGSDASFQERGSTVWPESLRIIRENPLGGGPGSSGPLSQARPTEAPFGRNIPDNGYLLMGVQFGLFGLLLFVAMLGTWLRDLVAWVRRGQAAAAAAAGVVVAAMIAMIAGSYWGLVNPSVALGVLVGLGLRGDGNRGPLRALSGRHPLSTVAPAGMRRAPPAPRAPVTAAPARGRRADDLGGRRVLLSRARLAGDQQSRVGHRIALCSPHPGRSAASRLAAAGSRGRFSADPARTPAAGGALGRRGMATGSRPLDASAVGRRLRARASADRRPLGRDAAWKSVAATWRDDRHPSAHMASDGLRCIPPRGWPLDGFRPACRGGRVRGRLALADPEHRQRCGPSAARAEAATGRAHRRLPRAALA